ncbi:KTSC domain-containing protein [Leptospira sp. WS92.C1]
MLETHYISSPEIESISYDFEIKELLVCFRNRNEKRFSNIKREIYTSLMQSRSKTDFIRKLIRFD